MNYEIECGNEYEIMHSKEPFADQVRSEELQSGLEDSLKDVKVSKLRKMRDVLKQGVVSYMSGLGAGLDILGFLTSPFRGFKTGTTTLSDACMIKAFESEVDLEQKLEEEYGQVGLRDDLGYPIFSTVCPMAAGTVTGLTIGATLGGVPYVISGLIDSVHGIYKYGKKAVKGD